MGCATENNTDAELVYRITDRLNCLVYHLKGSNGTLYAVCLTPDCMYFETCDAIMNSTPEFRAIRKRLAKE